MRREIQALVFGAFMAVTGMVIGAVLNLSLKDAVVAGAIATALFLAVVLPALRGRSDEEDDR